MKQLKILLIPAIALVGSYLLAAPALADSSFSNRKYSVTIGSDDSYHGCAPSGCLYIAEPRVVESGGAHYEWRNGKYRYIMDAMNRARTKYRLKVYNPRGKRILNQVLYED